MPKRGVIIVVSGPSGCGKNSIIEAAARQDSNLSYVTSATTREIRPKETEGVTYFYKTREEFEQLIEAGEILEWDEFCGNKYGTLKSELSKKIEQGSDVILDLTIAGAVAVKKAFPDDAAIVFILPPSIKELRTRLSNRQRESDSQIEARIFTAVTKEIPQANKFDYIIVNDVLMKAKDRLLAIILAERLKYKRNQEILDKLNLKGEDI